MTMWKKGVCRGFGAAGPRPVHQGSSDSAEPQNDLGVLVKDRRYVGPGEAWESAFFTNPCFFFPPWGPGWLFFFFLPD